MIQLKYRKEESQIPAIKHRLERMVLAHQLIEFAEADHPILVHGNSEFLGIEAIDQYLDQLESELGKWWYCGC